MKKKTYWKYNEEHNEEIKAHWSTIGIFYAMYFLKEEIEVTYFRIGELLLRILFRNPSTEVILLLLMGGLTTALIKK